MAILDIDEHGGVVRAIGEDGKSRALLNAVNKVGRIVSVLDREVTFQEDYHNPVEYHRN